MEIESMVRNIHWLGHDAFRIEGSKIIYFDPFEIKGDKPADIIFITHEHFDHCSPGDVEKIQKDDTVIVTEPASAKKLRGNIKLVSPGDRIEVGGVPVEVYPAYNVDKAFHPKKAGMLSFIVTLDGVRYYHAGNTDFIPEMKNLKVDVAFLPVSGTYVMDAREAVEAAMALQPKVAIPMHYGAIVGTEEDAKRFEEMLKGKVQVIILKKES